MIDLQGRTPVDTVMVTGIAGLHRIDGLLVRRLLGLGLAFTAVMVALVTLLGVAVIDAAGPVLTFVECQKDGVGGVDGLDGAVSVTVSPTGNTSTPQAFLMMRWRCLSTRHQAAVGMTTGTMREPRRRLRYRR